MFLKKSHRKVSPMAQKSSVTSTGLSGTQAPSVPLEPPKCSLGRGRSTAQVCPCAPPPSVPLAMSPWPVSGREAWPQVFPWSRASVPLRKTERQSSRAPARCARSRTASLAPIVVSPSAPGGVVGQLSWRDYAPRHLKRLGTRANPGYAGTGLLRLRPEPRARVSALRVCIPFAATSENARKQESEREKERESERAHESARNAVEIPRRGPWRG